MSSLPQLWSMHSASSALRFKPWWTSTWSASQERWPVSLSRTVSILWGLRTVPLCSPDWRPTGINTRTMPSVETSPTPTTSFEMLPEVARSPPTSWSLTSTWCQAPTYTSSSWPWSWGVSQPVMRYLSCPPSRSATPGRCLPPRRSWFSSTR